ncbi:hypothetical protein NO1_1863 [Candidatus Termititenax aidoneus]|uniref:Uncharacterized protein n=1 Tax=Termititenax aidoneus TaxID=2218524 RepID=A0A388TCX3_TERA1|nr:hypothetical protein NO1_1863 [Candidatus Termititenax aidoneus]
MANSTQRQTEKKINQLLYRAGMKDFSGRSKQDAFIQQLEEQTGELKKFVQSSPVLAGIIGRQTAELDEYQEKYKNFFLNDFLKLDTTGFDYFQKYIVSRQINIRAGKFSPEKLLEFAEAAEDENIRIFLREAAQKRKEFLALQ